AARLELIAEQPREPQAAAVISIVDRDENGMALEAVAVGALAPVVLPSLHELIRHAVVMNREEEIGPEAVCARGTLEEPAPRGSGGDQPDGLGATGIAQSLLDLVCEGQGGPTFGRA